MKSFESFNQIEILIYSLSGQVVFNRILQNPTEGILIDHNLTSGIYILNIIDSKGFYREKIIVE